MTKFHFKQLLDEVFCDDIRKSQSQRYASLFMRGFRLRGCVEPGEYQMHRKLFRCAIEASKCSSSMEMSVRERKWISSYSGAKFSLCNQFFLWFRSLNVIPLFPMPSLENYVQKIHKKLNNEGLETRKVWLRFCYAYVLWLHLNLN